MYARGSISRESIESCKLLTQHGKVKQGNLEWKLDFGTCCSIKFCSKSKTMFVWEAHLSTVKAGKSCLTLLLYLERTADQLLRVQKLVGGVTWNTSCLGS